MVAFALNHFGNPTPRPRRLRRPPAIVYPSALEREYAGQLSGMIDRLENIVQNKLSFRLSDLIRQGRVELGHRLDDFSDDLKALFEGIMVDFGRDLTDDEIKSIAQRKARQVADHNLAQNNKSIKTVLNVDVFRSEPWLQAQIDMFATQNVQLIKSIDKIYLDQVQNIIVDAVRTGRSIKDVEQELRQRFGVGKRKAEFLARDQIGKLNGQLTMLRQQELNITRYRWRTSLDERVRPTHRSKEGRIFSWNRAPIGTGHPGEDYNCFTGDTLIRSFGDINKIYRRWYDGEIITLHFADKRQLTVTPNHPIMTTKGWVAAGELDDTFYCFGGIDTQNAMTSMDMNVNDSHAALKEIFDFAQLSGTAMRESCSKDNFHGDGVIDTQIDTILVDRVLRDRLKSKFGQPIKHLFFADAIGVLVDRHETLMLDAGRDGLLASIIDGNQFVFCDLAFTLRSAGNIVPNQYFADRAPSDAKFGSNLIFRDAGNVQIANRAIGQRGQFIPATRNHFGDLNAFSTHAFGQDVWMNTDDSADGDQRIPFAVKPNRVVDIDRHRFSGHVYNLETQMGSYIADGHFVANCRCYAEPLLQDLVG